MDATLRNLQRKATFVDRVQTHAGIVLPSWVEINPTELCNRTCPFCPRRDEAEYPNQPLHMGLGLAEKIAGELRELDYQGTVMICGFGEPLLHPRIVDLVRAFGEFRVEITSNGDRLTPDLVHELTAAGCDFICVSMYDGAHQIDRLNAVFSGVDSDSYALRDRWQPEEQNFGLSFLTNRAGTVTIGRQKPVDQARPCLYPSYQMMIDWNGDVLLCPQDWHKRVRFGNLSTERLIDVWGSRAMRKRRAQLWKGREGLSPCSGCNSNGCLHGSAHAEAWA